MKWYKIWPEDGSNLKGKKKTRKQTGKQKARYTNHHAVQGFKDDYFNVLTFCIIYLFQGIIFPNPKNSNLSTHKSLLLLLLSRFSRVRLCDPIDGSPQASPPLGFSRQEHWSGLPFPSPVHESEKWKWSRSVMSDSSDPMDCSLPGSPVHGIFQARVLEWVAIMA